MLIKDSFQDVQTSTNEMRIYLFTPTLPPSFPALRKLPAIILFSEIYQVTAPIKRLARRLAGEGFIVACPSVFHEFEGARAMRYDADDTARGNAYKVQKHLSATDEDARVTVDLLVSLEHCSGGIGALGICYGGHLSVRAAFDARVTAAVSLFGTDMQSASLSPTGDDTLARIKGNEVPSATELLLVFGKLDAHVNRAGRDVIRETADAAGVRFSWLELSSANHAFVRDEDEKGRYDPVVTQICLSMAIELFSRTICLS